MSHPNAHAITARIGFIYAADEMGVFKSTDTSNSLVLLLVICYQVFRLSIQKYMKIQYQLFSNIF